MCDEQSMKSVCPQPWRNGRQLCDAMLTLRVMIDGDITCSSSTLMLQLPAVWVGVSCTTASTNLSIKVLPNRPDPSAKPDCLESYCCIASSQLVNPGEGSGRLQADKSVLLCSTLSLACSCAIEGLF